MQNFGFQTNPSFRWIKGREYIQLEEDLIYLSKDNKVYRVPKYFASDLASIPKFLWPIDHPSEKTIRLPAILHDYLYWLKGSEPFLLNRKECDKLFLECMLSENALKWKAYSRYYALRLFGHRW